ncbi:MAG: hypothetical protein QXI10_03455, partial [Candidatus Diapherotrites archaeon]
MKRTPTLKTPIQVVRSSNNLQFPLKHGIKPNLLKANGLNSHDLLQIGYTPDDLKALSFSCNDVARALFSNNFSYSEIVGELKHAKFSPKEIALALKSIYCDVRLIAQNLRYFGFLPNTIKSALN